MRGRGRGGGKSMCVSLSALNQQSLSCCSAHADPTSIAKIVNFNRKINPTLSQLPKCPCLNHPVTHHYLNPPVTHHYLNPSVTHHCLNPSVTHHYLNPPVTHHYLNPSVTHHYLNPVSCCELCANGDITKDKCLRPSLDKWRKSII